MSEKLNTKLFDSLTDAVPPVRATLDVFPVRAGNRQLMYFHDSMGYATENFAVDKSIAGLLPLLDGVSSTPKIVERIRELGGDVSEKELAPFIKMLDENRILFSDYFKDFKNNAELEFESTDLRKATCAGISYPAEKKKIQKTFDTAFSKVKNGIQNRNGIKALFAPHIDPRVGIETYAKAFAPLKDEKPKRVIILGTSHYAGSYFDLYDNTPFISSQKNFETPMGVVKSDAKFAKMLSKHQDEIGLSIKDRAHRAEHSIELHLIFLQYLWNHEFTVTPILVNSFDQLMYKSDGALGAQVEKMGQLLSELQKEKDVLVLISGDLSHFGHKFGDTEKASDMFSEVKLFDGRFLEAAKNQNSEKLLSEIAEVYDRYKICGFAPLYTWLKSAPKLQGEVTSYQLWDERERESAVSFGSVIYS